MTLPMAILVITPIAILIILMVKISSLGILKGGVFRIIATILILVICLVSFFIGHRITFIGFEWIPKSPAVGWIIMIGICFFGVTFPLRTLFASKEEVSASGSVTGNQSEENRRTVAEKREDKPKSTLDDIKQAFVENRNVLPAVEQVPDSIQSKVI